MLIMPLWRSSTEVTFYFKVGYSGSELLVKRTNGLGEDERQWTDSDWVQPGNATWASICGEVPIAP